MTSQVWQEDPKRLLFVLARYKFAAKLLAGRQNVLEIGCADAFGTRIVRQAVERLVAIDFDPLFVNDVLARADGHWPFECRVHDILDGPVEGDFDGAYSIDVLEHITPERENEFLGNICRSLTEHGALLLGSPSIESQVYASDLSKMGHVNCKNERQLRGLMEGWFHNVFLFSMNDEVVHTGFPAMAHYLFALGCSTKVPR
jgi:cyclopropane fatty-acyl-phospholipid synthase-like methyltransferase